MEASRRVYGQSLLDLSHTLTSQVQDHWLALFVHTSSTASDTVVIESKNSYVCIMITLRLDCSHVMNKGTMSLNAIFLASIADQSCRKHVGGAYTRYVGVAIQAAVSEPGKQ